jgi:predicted permease
MNMGLLQAMLNTVLPVFILAGLGFMCRRVLKAEVKDPAKITMYLLTPGLIANTILTTKLMAAEAGKIVAFCLLLTAIMIGLTLLLGRLLGWDPAKRSASVLSTAFMNSANYGLPITLFALGQAGFDRAAVFVIVEQILMYTLAAFFAARGQMDGRQAVSAVFKLPLVWAALGALVIRFAGITLPEMLLKPVGLLANGAPVVLVILLGMQVAGIELRGNVGRIGLLAALRLVVSPLVGLALVALLKPEPITARALVLESSMPAAVNATLLALQFNAEPDQVSGVTLVSTLASLVTLTFWVWFLTR